MTEEVKQPTLTPEQLEQLRQMTAQLQGIDEELHKPSVGDYVVQNNTPVHKLMETLDCFPAVDVARIKVRVQEVERLVRKLESPPTLEK